MTETSTSFHELDVLLNVLHSEHFATILPGELAELLGRTIATTLAASDEWVNLSCEAKRIAPDSPLAGEEWFAGPVVVIRNLRLLRETFLRKKATSRIRPGTDVRATPYGPALDVFPTNPYDALFFRGFRASALLRDGTELNMDTLADAATAAYTNRYLLPPHGVSLVLGAGNVSSIPIMDALHRIFACGRPCIVKMSPVNEYLVPVFERAFAPLIEANLLQFVTGGEKEGTYLARHHLVCDVHITGSHRTHDVIVWGGPGPIAYERKRLGKRILHKPITSELGNISPVMIVPGTYTDAELTAMAWNVATQIANNASFNCNAAKLIILSRGWTQRNRFMDMLRARLRGIAPRFAYYPGAQERYTDLVRFAERVEVLKSIDPTTGDIDKTPGILPWTIAHVSHGAVWNPLFSEEPFCALTTVTMLPATTPALFLADATTFCNTRVWGTLNACIMIDPRTERMLGDQLAAAVRALEYGTVGINHWPALGYGFVSPPWGGHPSSTLGDVRSGIGWVHNTFLIPDDLIEKVVLRGPLVVSPKPAWFANNRMAHVIGRKLAAFEAAPSLLKLPGIISASMRG